MKTWKYYCLAAILGTALVVLPGCGNKTANPSNSGNNPPAGMTNGTSPKLPAPATP